MQCTIWDRLSYAPVQQHNVRLHVVTSRMYTLYSVYPVSHNDAALNDLCSMFDDDFGEIFTTVHGEKGTGKKGTGKKGTGKKGTEKRAQEKWAQEKRAQVKI